jgi:calcineurin-like phosphoesterase family protein
MGQTWFISDTHYGHEKTCTEFKRADGSPLRPFANAEEMNEVMVERWNTRVRPEDKVYHLGDVVIHKRFLPIVGRLNGSKRLVRGNHDVFKTREYLEYFKEVYGVRVLPDLGLVLSHIPLHLDSIRPRFGTNLHGHLHAGVIDHPAYVNVCVEHTDYAPISLDEIMAIKERNG